MQNYPKQTKAAVMVAPFYNGQQTGISKPLLIIICLNYSLQQQFIFYVRTKN
jgi:hypothetical protein